MTIEKTHASSEAKSAPASESKAAKSKTGSSDATAGGDGGGFMAVLAAVDTPAAPTPVATVDLSQSLQTLPLDQNAPLATPTNALPVSANSVAAMPMDAAALLAQSMQWSLPSQTPSTDVAAETPSFTAAEGRVPGSAFARLPTLAVGVQAPQNEVVEQPIQGSRKPFKSAMDWAALGQSGSSGAAVSPSGTNAPGDSKTALLFQKMDALSVPPPVETALTMAAAVVRREDQGRDHSVFKMDSSEGTLPAQPVVTGTPGTAVLTASAVVPPSDVYVAEQVKYWISNDVQNAELKLDGFGDSSVEVSISMQGNEAKVDFRTDEIRVREVLENASLHLKDLLEREGVLLSGVSVGTAGSDNSGNQEKKSRSGVRVGSVAAPSPKQVDIAHSRARTAGSALDLFV